MKSMQSMRSEMYGPALKMPHRKYGYFRDDEIVLLVTHKSNAIPEEYLANIANQFDQPLRKEKKDAIVSIKPKVNTFRELPNAPGDEAELGNLSLLIFSVEEAPVDPLYLPRIIDYFNKEWRANSDGGPRILGASPNWLTSVASQGAGTGGPGSRPTPYSGRDMRVPHPFSITTNLQQKGIYKEGEGVDVVILDTAPSAHALVAAPKEWPDHPIIKTLLGPHGKLTLYPAPYDEVVRLGNTSLNDHDYNMTDHGLFVAGIVHSIVPEAKIHLIEVLNQYGVGDLASFVRGLGLVMNELYDPERKLVLNCSWMLELPRSEPHCRHLSEQSPDAEFEQQVLQFSRNDQATANMLEYLFNQFHTQGRQAIAAAGNDGREGDTRLVNTRYPAALTKVKGVGALPRRMSTARTGQVERTKYSNLADDPPITGVSTLGGEAGEGKGVLGLYIGEFPVDQNPTFYRKLLNCLITLLGGRVAGPPNVTKWAWWAGTSFATPILTGAVAAVLSHGAGIMSTQAALQKLTAEGIIGDRATTALATDSTTAQEDVMIVFQH